MNNSITFEVLQLSGARFNFGNINIVQQDSEASSKTSLGNNVYKQCILKIR